MTRLDTLLSRIGETEVASEVRDLVKARINRDFRGGPDTGKAKRTK